MATLIAFIFGAIAGSALCYWLMSRPKSGVSLERQLKELQEEFTAYRENVNNHFNRTADLVNELTENYLAVQKHLETAADSFAEPPKSFKLESSEKETTKKAAFVSLEAKTTDEKVKQADAEFDSESAQQPRDYAPKSGKKDGGTLSEEFGLHDSKS